MSITKDPPETLSFETFKTPFSKVIVPVCLPVTFLPSHFTLLAALPTT
jgi:hypothetical protein